MSYLYNYIMILRQIINMRPQRENKVGSMFVFTLSSSSLLCSVKKGQILLCISP